MKSFTYTIKDPVGLHARPAGVLASKAAGFQSNILLKTGAKEADAKKLIRLMTLGLKQGDTVEVIVEGSDEEAAYTELQAFFNETL